MSVAKNSLFLFGAQTSAAILAFASSILIARKVGPYVTGQYTYLIWIGSLFTAVSTLGIPNALTKFTAEYSEQKRSQIAQNIAGKLLLGTTLIGVAAALILCGLAAFHWLPANSKNIYFYFIAFALPLNIVATSLVGLFKGNHRYNALMWGNIIASPVTFIVILLVLHYKPALSGLLLFYILTAIILLASYIIVAPGKIKISFGKIPTEIWRPILKYIVIVSGIILLDQVVWDRSEVIFLGHYSPPQQVAFYSLSYTLTNNAMTLLPGSIVGAMLPHIAGLQGLNDTSAIRTSYQTAVKYVGLMVAILAGGGIALATPLILIVYGHNYLDMIPAFRVLIFTQGWATIAGVSAVIFYGTTRQSIILKTGLVLSIINIAADYLIIPHHGALGAAIANGLAQLGGVISGIYFLTKKGIPFPIFYYIKLFGLTVLCSGAAFLVIKRFAYSSKWSVLIGGTFFLVLFCGLAIYSKLIELSEIPLLNRLMSDKL